MIPMKLTMEKPSGTLKSWGSPAADGVVAREAKSGAFLETLAGQRECYIVR